MTAITDNVSTTNWRPHRWIGHCSPALLNSCRPLVLGRSLTSGLDLPDGALGGIVAWYSIIHIPLERLAEVFAEFYRVLAPGGHVLLAFQVGDEPLYLTEAFGHAVSLDFHRRQPDRVAQPRREALRAR